MCILRICIIINTLSPSHSKIQDLHLHFRFPAETVPKFICVFNIFGLLLDPQDNDMPGKLLEL